MQEDLQKVIQMSTLIFHEDTFIYAKVKTAPPIENCFVIAKDGDEITVIAKKEYAGELDIMETSSTERSLFEIRFSPDSPDAAGFLAAVSTALAKEGISISVISTFSKDYLFVGKADTQKAMQTLTGLGFQT